MPDAKNTSDIDWEKLDAKRSQFGKITQYTLFFTTIVVIIGQFRVSDPNIKILYSLSMIIAASVGRTGTDVAYYLSNSKKDYSSKQTRSIIFNILWLFGILGMIFGILGL